MFSFISPAALFSYRLEFLQVMSREGEELESLTWLKSRRQKRPPSCLLAIIKRIYPLRFFLQTNSLSRFSAFISDFHAIRRQLDFCEL